MILVGTRTWLPWTSALLFVVLLAACGSSSSRSAHAGQTFAPKPAATTTAGGAGSGCGTACGNAGGNAMAAAPTPVPLNSPALRTALIAQFAKNRAIPAKYDAPLADCLIKKLQANGYKTVGDAQAHPNVVQAEATACAKQLTGR
jgi:hypothetical protein